MSVVNLSKQRDTIINFFDYINNLNNDIVILDLSFNKINDVDLQLINLEKFIKLKKLILDDNILYDLNGIVFPSHLEVLQLNFNDLTNLCGATFPLSLKRLELSQNDLCNNDMESVYHIPNLTILGMSKYDRIWWQNVYYEMRYEYLQEKKSSQIIKELNNIQERFDILLITYEILVKQSKKNNYRNLGRLKGLSNALNIKRHCDNASEQLLCEDIVLRLILNKESNIPFSHPMIEGKL